jgi:hypothetical protein
MDIDKDSHSIIIAYVIVVIVAVGGLVAIFP